MGIAFGMAVTADYFDGVKITKHERPHGVT